MTYFEIVILIGAICGPIMVIGSMVLLYKGAISLQQAATDNALSIEVVNEVKLSTRYPALALFVIGLIFFVSAAWFAQQGDTKKIILTGEVSSPDELVDIEIHLSAGPWKQNVVDDRGLFSILFYPNIENLKATVVAPGYEKSGISRIVSVSQKHADIGTIQLGHRVVDDIPVSDDIVPRQPNGSSSRGAF